MTNQFVDLHCHSTASDGTLAPAAVVQLARDAGLSALALTDHDTIAGCAAAAAEAQRLGIEFLPGIEISCEFPRPGTMHMLGYGIDPDSEILRELTTRLVAGRDDRNPRIVKKLNELGIAITMDEVEAESGGGVVGRPHIAAILLRKGVVSSIKQAFDQFLGQGGAAYFDKERITAREAIEMIGQSGGIASLAHPVQLRTENDAQLERILKDLADLGLSGVEVLHSDHNPAQIEKFGRLADRFGLIQTGGSDFHGTSKKTIQLGSVNGRRVPRWMLDGIRGRIEQQRAVMGTR